MKKRIELKITGKVQGVFFRQYARLEAQSRDIVGWARNMPDGSVEIAAEGDEKDLREFAERLAHGPELAVVAKVDVTWAEARGGLEEFSVL